MAVDPETITNNDLAACIAVLEAASKPGSFVLLKRLNPQLDTRLLDEVRQNVQIVCVMLDIEADVARVIS